MAVRKYDKLTIEDFGKHLLTSGDLDPIYFALNRMRLGQLQKRRWLLSYWCYYNAGIASYLSEIEDPVAYWDTFLTAAANAPQTPSPLGGGKVNGNWPRGAERRHFRGQQAIKATMELITKYPDPTSAIDHLVRATDEQPIPFSTVSDRVQEWRGFGSWISFKVGDMLDRCGVAQVAFSFEDAMYDTPTKAALIQWKLRRGIPQESTIDDEKAAVREEVEHLINHFAAAGHLAPPLMDRPVGFQEIETILCKWKSHMGGSYPLYNDIDEIRHGASSWAPHSATAKLFLDCCPTR